MLADALLEAKSRIDGYRASVRSVYSKAPGMDVYGSAVGSDFGGMLEYRKAGALTNQYKAAMTGIPYTAIRPAAIKIAGQSVRVGYRRHPESAENEPPMRTKMREIARKKSGRVLLAKQMKMSQVAPPWIKRMQDDVEVLPTHPFMQAIEDPNEMMTQWALMWCTVFSIYATGQAVWLIDEVRGRLKLWYIPTTWAQPVHKPTPYAAWEIKPVNGDRQPVPVPARNIVHFMMPDPANPMLPHAPLMAHSRVINTDDQIQQSQYQSMKNGIRPGVILRAGRLPPPPGSTGGPMRPILTPEQRKQLISAIQLAYRGVERHGEPIIVDGMIEDVEPWTRSPQEMDYSEGAKLTEGRIMKGFATNPIVAGEIEGANRASSFVAHDGFYAINVNPLINYMSQVITRRIGPLYSTDRNQVVAWIEEAKAYDKDLADGRMRSVLTIGAVTRGEARRWVATGDIDLPEREDDDELLKSAAKKPNSKPQGDNPEDEEDDESVSGVEDEGDEEDEDSEQASE